MGEARMNGVLRHGVSGEELREKGPDACREEVRNEQQAPQAVKREPALPEVAQDSPAEDAKDPDAAEAPVRKVTETR